MPASGSSYIGRSRPRQSPSPTRGIAAAALTLVLGGCTAMGLPFGEAGGRQVSHEVTGSIPNKATATDAVDASDWEAVRRTVASIPADAPPSRVEWSNPDTGSTGTIATIQAPIDRTGMWCRSFATTVNDMRGVRRYRGQACLRTDGRWQLRGMTADDAQLS